MTNDNKKTLIDSFKSLAPVIASLIAIYSAMWAAGVAPITNGRAAEMVKEAVTENNTQLKTEVEALRNQQIIMNSQINAMKEKVGSIEKNTDNTNQNVQRLIELIIQNNP